MIMKTRENFNLADLLTCSYLILFFNKIWEDNEKLPINFPNFWLNSKTYKRIVSRELPYINKSYKYIAEDFQQELSQYTGERVDRYPDNDGFCWFGYLTVYYYFCVEPDIDDLLNKNWLYVYENSDILHTEDVYNTTVRIYKDKINTNKTYT